MCASFFIRVSAAQYGSSEIRALALNFPLASHNWWKWNAEIVQNIFLSFNLFIFVRSYRILNIKCWRCIIGASRNAADFVHFVATLPL